MNKICTCGHKETLHATYHIEENQKITLSDLKPTPEQMVWFCAVRAVRAVVFPQRMCVECLCKSFDDCTEPNFCSCLDEL